MKEQLLYNVLNLVFLYFFLLMVLRAVYFTFLLKKEPLDSVKIVPKIKWKTKKDSIEEIAKKEIRKEKISKWG